MERSVIGNAMTKNSETEGIVVKSVAVKSPASKGESAKDAAATSAVAIWRGLWQRVAGQRATQQRMRPWRPMRSILTCAFALSLGLTGALAGCAASDLGLGDGVAQTEDNASSDASSSWAAVAAAFDASALDLGYSNRDSDASYDASSATMISLSDDGATVSGQGASAEESCVTITEAGTYVVSGELTCGQLVVDAGDEKVQVVLAGVAIHNETGPAVYVRQADKCFITLAEGTTNALSDGADYVLEEDSDEPYATLFSRDDLTLNGAGTLVVTGSYRHAICSKDDLVITGGTYIIDAAEDGLRGRDCVKIADGAFTITAGRDAIKSNNDTDAMRGFVSLDGGTFTINAQDEGVQAQTYVRIAGASLDVTAADDAFHSDLEMLIAGGSCNVSAGDDAFHAETKLIVDGGEVNVSSCYEGYEAEKIYVNGGESFIVAKDDAINASAADLSDESDSASLEDAAPEGGAAPGGEQGLPGGAADKAPDGMAGGMAEGALGGSEPGGNVPGGGNASDPGAGAFAPGSGNRGAFGEGDESCLIQINGGYIVLDAAGDGVDSNGSIEITGGTLLVNGPASGGDGALDYDLEATVTGGTVIMVGSMGMAQSFSDGTQPFAMVSVNGNAGDVVSVLDRDGNEVAALNASKQFGMVLVSSPVFKEGETYSLVVGGQANTITPQCS